MKVVIAAYLSIGLVIAGGVENWMLKSCPAAWSETPQTTLARAAASVLFWPAMLMGVVGQAEPPAAAKCAN